MLWTRGSIRIGICGGTMLWGGGCDGCCGFDGAAVCIGPLWMAAWPLCIGCVVIADVTTAGTEDGAIDVVAVWLLPVAMLELVAIFAFAFACITVKDIMQFFDIRLVTFVYCINFIRVNTQR